MNKAYSSSSVFTGDNLLAFHHPSLLASADFMIASDLPGDRETELFVNDGLSAETNTDDEIWSARVKAMSRAMRRFAARLPAMPSSRLVFRSVDDFHHEEQALTTPAITSATEWSTIGVQIHPELDPSPVRTLVDPGRVLWNPRDLRRLTARAANVLAAPLSGVVRYVPEQRWWARLALTWGVELWLLSWLPGQGTRPHDHGGASGAFTVMTGALDETYRYPGRSLRRVERATGVTIGFGAGHAHQVRNTTDFPAMSLHAYSPPLVPTREYANLSDIPDRIPPLPARPCSFAELRVLADREGW